MEVENPQNIIKPVVIYASLGKKSSDPFEFSGNNYVGLRKELEVRFRRFHNTYFLDDNGKPYSIDTDDGFEAARNYQNLRLFLTKNIFTKLDLDRISEVNWVSELKQNDKEKCLSYLEILHTIGFKSWRKNLKLLKNTDYNLATTIDSLTTGKKIPNKPKPKKIREKRQRPERLDKSEKRRVKKQRVSENKENLSEKVVSEKEEREKKKMLRKVASESYVEISEWPKNISVLYIDGNNLMYVSDKLRKLTLNHKKKRVQQVLNYVAESFSKIYTLSTTVVYDITSETSPLKELENGSKISVISAKPLFNSSDDLLIDWSKENVELSKNTAVVTSDRALAGQLNSSGVTLIRPMEWIRFVASEIVGQSMDAKEWLDALVDQDLH